MSVYEIALAPTPMRFQLSLGGATWGFSTAYVDSENPHWSLSMFDGAGNPLACGLPMVAGANILHGLDYIGFPGVLFISTDGAPQESPNAATLGITSHLMLELA